MSAENIIIAPFEVYLAPVGETFPEIQATPGGNWATLGTNGIKDYSEDGVTVNHEQTLSQHRTLGSTGPVKVVRTEESLLVSFTLEDLTLEEYAKILNGQSVTDVAADADTGGYRHIPLRQGRSVNTYAMLIRGVSPYGSSYNAQYEIAQAFQSANPSPVFNKSDAAGLECEWTALEDPTQASEEDRFGRLVMQDAAPTG